MVLATLVAALMAVAASSSLASPGDQSGAYQQDAGHDGHISNAGLAAPLTQAWSITLPGAVSYPLIVNGTVFVTAANHTLYALNQATGSTVWSHGLGGTYAWSGLAYDRGRVFAVNSSGVLTAFDAATGSIAWSEQLPGQYLFSSPPTAANGIVYTGGAGSGGTVYAVRESDGHVLWTQAVANGDHSSPAVTAQGVYVSYACQQAYAFDPLLGTLLWHHNSSCEGGGGKTPVAASGHVFVRDNPLGNIILSPSTGAVQGPFSAGPAPAVANNVAFMLSGSTLTAIAASGLGSNDWTFGGDGQLDTAPLVVGGLVIVGSSGGNLYALNAATGGTSWSTNVGSSISAPDEQNEVPLTGLAAANGTLVVPAGSQLSAYRTAGAITNAPSSLSLPTIDGSTQVSQIHAADVGIWSELPSSYKYQWQLCNGSGATCKDIQGATRPSYTPPAGDIGSTLRVEVVASNGVGSSASAESAASAKLVAAPGPMSLAASKHTVTYAGKVNLKLTGVTTSGKVDLFATPKGQAPTLVGTATVAAGHSATFTVAPKLNTAYLAEREDQAAESNGLSVSVRPQLVLAVRAKRISSRKVRRRGEKVLIGAGRNPPLPGEPLTFEVDRARHHGHWRKVARGEFPVGSTGVAVVVFATKVPGRYRAVARYKPDGNYASAHSRWRTFRVG